jgi:hypothetical protein
VGPSLTLPRVETHPKVYNSHTQRQVKMKNVIRGILAAWALVALTAGITELVINYFGLVMPTRLLVSLAAIAIGTVAMIAAIRLRAVNPPSFRSRSVKIIAGTVTVAGLLYLLELTLVTVGAKPRAVIGIILQLLTGLFLTLDQVIEKTPTKDSRTLWDWVMKNKLRISLIGGIAAFVILMVVIYVVQGQRIDVPTNFALLFGTMLFSIPYLYGLQWMQRLISRNRRIDERWSMVLADVIIVAISAPAVLVTGLSGPGNSGISTAWFVIAGLLFMPSFIFSSAFLLIVLSIELLNFMRQKLSRVAFWWSLLGLWSWGGLLLLADVLARP